MDHTSFTIDLATRNDLAGILDLQERNLYQHGGKLSIRWPADWFEAAIAAMPLIVARSGGRVVGYLVSTPPAAQADMPIIQAMLAAYPGSAGAYLYGPICVDDGQRNRGVAHSMFRELRARLPGREGFTFIRHDNTPSRTAHAKMGLRDVGRFEHGGIEYVVAAYVG